MRIERPLPAAKKYKITKLGKARTKLEQTVVCPIVKIWTLNIVSGSLKCMIYICQSKESTYRETPEIALIQIFDKTLLDTAPQILTQTYHQHG